METLVLGMGNLLLGDEGVGVHAARTLREAEPPPGVEVMEVGTALLDALPAIAAAERIVVIDAMVGGGEPGSVYRVPLRACARPQPIGSVHGFDLSGVLALAGRSDPPPVLVVGVEPQRIDWSTELSPTVADALPTVIETVLRECSAPRTDLSHVAEEAS